MLRLLRIASLFLVVLAPTVACNDSAPTSNPGPLETGQPVIAPPPATSLPEAMPAATHGDDAGTTDDDAPPAPWEGPFLGITRTSIGIYSQPTFDRELKLGYAQEGSKLPVHAEPVVKSNCKGAWYRAVGGGFVCGTHGTTNLEDPRLRNGPRQPNLDDILPYQYARNAANGTPLYRSVPSAEQVRQYEPYLFKDKKKAKSSAPSSQPAPTPDSALDEQTRKAREDQARRMEALRAAQRAMLGEAAAKKLEAAAASPTAARASERSDAGTPRQEWWQSDETNLHELKLADLDAQGDAVLARRLVKGFYIAVDRQFDWNKRRWYRSTKGFVAPVDRFHLTAGSDFKGIELDDTWQLPIGWVYGWNKSRNRYTIDPAQKTVKRSGSIARFDAVNLNGSELEIGKTTYVQSVDGDWLRKRDLRITRPGPPPADLGQKERWVDVNLTTQTLVLFEGTRPIYATLVSTGKQHEVKERDHSTPTGEWRIREKHITSTMDGDGSAAGDLPYSIEAVPYVMYYHRAYALHGAFWHQNYGVRMSHGCVNLAPLDAKHVFFATDPPVPEGWHGAWSSTDRPGSRVVVHE